MKLEILSMKDVVPVKMEMSRIGRSTDGKFVHRIIPIVLELVFHADEPINLSL